MSYYHHHHHHLESTSLYKKAGLENLYFQGDSLLKNEVIKLFNDKPKSGIARIKKWCTDNNQDFIAETAKIFYEEKSNLNLEFVGDYLGTDGVDNQKVLESFTKQFDFKEKDYLESLRRFLQSFKLPGEAQKIDRLVESFGTHYYEQNLNIDINSKDAAYILAYQTIMLNTDLHNPSIAKSKKMTFEQLKNNLKGTNESKNFNDNFLKKIYDEIEAKPFKLNFVKTSPGYELTSTTLNKDSTFKKLDSFLHSTDVNINTVFPGIGDNVKTTVDQPKSWLSFFTGYKGTITLTDNKTSAQATIQVYTPNIFSKWLFGEQPRVIIQPGQTKESIDLAAKAAADFSSPVKNFKATYDYEVGDLIKAYDNQKKLITIERNLALKEGVPKDPDAEMQKEKGRQLKF
uniref:PROLINE/BETAINE TRANSPORTER, RALF n=1 Tax=Legionella pneumophila subsp. pneumophila (strain Philadelphia 1 / ATCC 33152 / DSM 7513) TaxID=272624 RepID=UPI00058401C2|nr:Chain A, PROLINE/BETAINE TRANSPORTER, RALF [synthetic construct]